MPCSCRSCSSCFPYPFTVLTYSGGLAPTIPRLHLQPPTIQVHLLSAGIIRIMLIWPRNVVFLVRKLAGWQRDAFSLPASSTRSSLVYLLDKLFPRHFLVASRASVSVFPAPASSTSSGVKLMTADSSSILCSGSRIIPLHLGFFSFD